VLKHVTLCKLTPEADPKAFVQELMEAQNDSTNLSKVTQQLKDTTKKLEVIFVLH
jgi:hypothetical protein